MLGFYFFHGVLRKFVLFSTICSDRPFRYWMTSIRGVHFVHQFKPKKPIKRFSKYLRKPVKSVEKKDVDPKVYMRDTVSNIYKILRYSTWDSARAQLGKLSIRWDSYTINQVLKTHPPMEKAWLFFNWASRLKGFKHDQFTYTTMLDIFGEAGRISSMNYVFQLMQENGIKIDAVTYTSIMHWLSNYGDIDGAMKVWEDMKAKGCYPTVVSYTAFMKALLDNNRVKEASDVYKEMLQSGFSPNCHTYTALMEYLVGSGKYEEALEIFSKMQEAGVQPDKAACNILVEKCCKVGETRAMTKILWYMKENSLVLHYPVFLEAHETLKVAGKSDALLRQVNPHSSVECISDEEPVEFISTVVEAPLALDRGLVFILLKKQNLVAIDCLLAGIMDKNIQLDSAIISIIIKVNCDCCRPDGALLAFKYSVKMGIHLERTAYLALVGVSIRSNTFPKVVEIVEEMIRAGHSLGVYLGTLLIYRLGRAARPVCAAKIFNLLPDDQKCTATYTALVVVYFTAGSANKGLKIYETMQRKGIRPSLGTYNVLLSGLKKSGRVCEAETYRKEMKSLQNDGNIRETVPMEEKICDLLFAGNVVS